MTDRAHISSRITAAVPAVFSVVRGWMQVSNNGPTSGYGTWNPPVFKVASKKPAAEY